MTRDERIARVNVNSIARPRQRKKTEGEWPDRLRETQFYAKKRPLPLRVKRAIGAIGEDSTTKRRRFGDHYFRPGRLSLFPLSHSHPRRLSVAYFATCIGDFTRDRTARNTAAHFAEAQVRQEMLKSAALLRIDTARRGSMENGSAVLRFVSRKKRTYVTHYPCCGPCSKLWLSSTSSAARALVPRGR